MGNPFGVFRPAFVGGFVGVALRSFPGVSVRGRLVLLDGGLDGCAVEEVADGLSAALRSCVGYLVCHIGDGDDAFADHEDGEQGE